MNEEEIKKIAEQAMILIRPLVIKSDVISVYTSTYFRNADEEHKENLKTMILDNIKIVKDNLIELEILLK